MVALIKEEKKRCVPASLPVQYLPFFFLHCTKARNPVIPQMPCPIFTVHCHHWFWGVEDYSHLGDVLVTWLQNLLIIDPFVSVPPFSPWKASLRRVKIFISNVLCFHIWILKKKHAPTKRPMECRPPLITLPPLTGSDLSSRALCSQQSRALSPRYLYTVWGTSAGSERSSCVCSLSLQQAGLSAKDSLGAGSGTHSQL